MDAEPAVNALQGALASTSLHDPAIFQQVRDFLAPYSDVEVLRHWTTDPLPGAPAILDDAIGVAPDLEWLSQNPKIKVIEQIEGKITQVGWTVFPMAALKDCKSPADFPTLIKKAATYYIRPIETCHLRSKQKAFENTEMNPLYCQTRFVTEEEAKTIFKNVLDNQILKDGQKAPVILLGHGWPNDERQLKKEWSFHVSKLDSIVYKINSLGKLATQIGLAPTPYLVSSQPDQYDQTYINLDQMLAAFGITMTGMWRHNGANDAVYQMTLAFLLILFPILYPTTSGGFPADSSIAGRTINDIFSELAANKNNVPILTEGYAQYCFYCDTPDLHDGTDADPCPAKGTLAITCQLCINTVGKANKKYRERAHDHQTHRCTFQWSHVCRKFPEEVKIIDWSLEDKRTLTRGMALGDDAMIGRVFRKNIAGDGPIDWTVVRDEEKRLEFEAQQYGSEGEEEELDLVDD